MEETKTFLKTRKNLYLAGQSFLQSTDKLHALSILHEFYLIQSHTFNQYNCHKLVLVNE